jgi:hypothetical protein
MVALIVRQNRTKTGHSMSKAPKGTILSLLFHPVEGALLQQ